jgi:hypothetical protein
VRNAKRAGQEEPNVLREGIALADAKRNLRDEEVAPVVPALKAALSVAIDQRVSKSTNVADIPELIVEALIASTDSAEAATSMGVKSIPSVWSEIAGRHEHIARLLFLCGRRAMEIADSRGLVLVRSKIHALFQGNNQQLMRDLGSELTSLACWLTPQHAMRFCDWFVDLTKSDTGQSATHAALCLCRIGGAALSASMPSVAFASLSTIKARGHNVVVLRDWVMDDGLRTHEQLRSDLNGRYLGDSPLDALANFFKFSERLAPFA